MPLDGIEEVLLRSGAPAGENPDSGYIYTWYEIDGSDIILKGEKDDGTVVNIGVQGPQGIQGPAGNDGADGDSAYQVWLNEGNTGTEQDFIDSLVGADGPQGIQGPQGPMTVEALINEQTDVTLPNSTNKQDIYTNTITMGAAGNTFLLVGLCFEPHATGSDYEFDLEVNGSVIQPEMAEEGKDTSGNQKHWRSYPLNTGNLPATPFDIVLRFSKESAGGTFVLKGYTAILVRYS